MTSGEESQNDHVKSINAATDDKRWVTLFCRPCARAQCGLDVVNAGASDAVLVSVAEHQTFTLCRLYSLEISSFYKIF